MLEVQTCKETKPKKKSPPKPKPTPKKRASIILKIDDMLLNPSSFICIDRVMKLGRKVHKVVFMLSKDQGIAFRSTLPVKEIFYTNRRDMEVRYEGKGSYIDILRGCRIRKITNGYTQDDDVLEKYVLSVESIEYAKEREKE